MVVDISLATTNQFHFCREQKIKFNFVAHFSSLTNSVFIHHVHHAKNHVLTIKKPRQHLTYFRTPFKNPNKNAKVRVAPPQDFFLRLNLYRD
jgi:hypothetical protein